MDTGARTFAILPNTVLQFSDYPNALTGLTLLPFIEWNCHYLTTMEVSSRALTVVVDENILRNEIQSSSRKAWLCLSPSPRLQPLNAFTTLYLDEISSLILLFYSKAINFGFGHKRFLSFLVPTASLF